MLAIGNQYIHNGGYRFEKVANYAPVKIQVPVDGNVFQNVMGVIKNLGNSIHSLYTLGDFLVIQYDFHPCR